MNLDRISVSLEASKGRKHSFDIVEEDNQIFFMVGEQVIATVNVTTMTKEVRDEDGDYHEKLSDNFYIIFTTTDPVAKKECMAMAWVNR